MRKSINKKGFRFSLFVLCTWALTMKKEWRHRRPSVYTTWFCFVWTQIMHVWKFLAHIYLRTISINKLLRYKQTPCDSRVFATVAPLLFYITYIMFKEAKRKKLFPLLFFMLKHKILKRFWLLLFPLHIQGSWHQTRFSYQVPCRKNRMDGMYTDQMCISLFSHRLVYRD